MKANVFHQLPFCVVKYAYLTYVSAKFIVNLGNHSALSRNLVIADCKSYLIQWFFLQNLTLDVFTPSKHFRFLRNTFMLRKSDHNTRNNYLKNYSIIPQFFAIIPRVYYSAERLQSAAEWLPDNSPALLF